MRDELRLIQYPIIVHKDILEQELKTIDTFKYYIY